MAEEWLRDVLHQSPRGTLAAQTRTGATFADTAAEWLRYVDFDWERKPSTVAGYKVIVRTKLLPAFGEMALEAITTEAIGAGSPRRAGYTPEEVWALVRAAANPTDARLFLTAAFTGLRLGELLAVCWRDVDFSGAVVRVRASYSSKALTTPKSEKVRAVPMAPDVASALAQLGSCRD